MTMLPSPPPAAEGEEPQRQAERGNQRQLLSRIEELELERDGAFAEADAYRVELLRLVEGAQILTRIMKRGPPPAPSLEDGGGGGGGDDDDGDDDEENVDPAEKDGRRKRIIKASLSSSLSSLLDLSVGGTATTDANQQQPTSPGPVNSFLTADDRRLSDLSSSPFSPGDAAVAVASAANLPPSFVGPDVLSPLSNACHMVRENLRLASAEAAAAVEDAAAARRCAAESARKLERAERAARKLYKENKKLRDEAERAGKERAALVRKVKKLLAERRAREVAEREALTREAEREVAREIEVHEMHLQRQRRRGAGGEQEGSDDDDNSSCKGSGNGGEEEGLSTPRATDGACAERSEEEAEYRPLTFGMGEPGAARLPFRTSEQSPPPSISADECTAEEDMPLTPLDYSPESGRSYSYETEERRSVTSERSAADVDVLRDIGMPACVSPDVAEGKGGGRRDDVIVVAGGGADGGGGEDFVHIVSESERSSRRGGGTGTSSTGTGTDSGGTGTGGTGRVRAASEEFVQTSLAQVRDGMKNGMSSAVRGARQRLGTAPAALTGAAPPKPKAAPPTYKRSLSAAPVTPEGREKDRDVAAQEDSIGSIARGTMFQLTSLFTVDARSYSQSFAKPKNEPPTQPRLSSRLPMKISF